MVCGDKERRWNCLINGLVPVTSESDASDLHATVRTGVAVGVAADVVHPAPVCVQDDRLLRIFAWQLETRGTT